LNPDGECVLDCAPGLYKEMCPVTSILKCYPCHKSCLECENGAADACTSCAAGYRSENLGLKGVCYPIEVAEEFSKWQSNYSSDLITKLVKKKSFRKKWKILNLIY